MHLAVDAEHNAVTGIAIALRLVLVLEDVNPQCGLSLGPRWEPEPDLTLVRPGTPTPYLIEVTDPGRVDAFQMELILEVGAARDRNNGFDKRGAKNANTGKGKQGGSESTLSLPDITAVRREHWDAHDFDEASALKVVHVGTPDDATAPVYDFYVNYDNKYLLHSYKQRGADAALLEKQFVYGLVLVGLALLQDHRRRSQSRQESHENVEDLVLRTTSALGSVLVPMLQTIGGLDAADPD